ncbi:unnamed protein product [Lactuca saligna]|uniref:Uncharacterized protein n=1 Tax=Lactuca saligna TaxID=75948 RepID=A0AA35Y767_LACSI|nr:unnamed protein product [Lactuca saligna]
MIFTRSLYDNLVSFNLMNVLYDAFGDKVKALFQHPHEIEDPPMAPTQSTSCDLPVDPPPPRTTIIIDRFEKEPELHHVEVETQIHEEDDEDLNDDVEFLKEIYFTGISDDIATNIEHDLDDDEFGPIPGFDNDCFRKVNEVASSATKTGEDNNVLKIFLSSSKTLEIPSCQRDVNSKIPPSISTISTSAPLIIESSQPQTSQSSLEKSQSNTSMKVPIVSHEPQVFSTVTTTTVFTPPIQSDEGASTMFETGGSSSNPKYSPTRPSLDDASIRLAKNLPQHSPTSSSRAKGISFTEEHSGDDKSTVSELREAIGVLRQELIEKNI